MVSLRRVPVHLPLSIAVLIALDIALVVAPAVDFMAGSPSATLRTWLNLNTETSLSAWYSSMQWFCAGVLFGAFALYAWRSRPPGVIPLVGLALLCVAFSADEIVAVHEWLGMRTDALLPGGDRVNTALWRTGFWPMLIGLPVIALLGTLLWRMRRIFLPAPRALRLLIVGFAVMFAGSLVVELAANAIGVGPETGGLLLLQLICEEFLEMLGVSIIVWSAYELLRAYGFRLEAPVQFGAAAEPARPAVYELRPGANPAR